MSDRNNESVGQDGNSSSHSQGKTVGLNRGRFGMLSGINYHALYEKSKAAKSARRRRLLLGRVFEKMNVNPPSIQELLDANRMIYIEETVREVLSYQSLSDGNGGMYESYLFYTDESLDLDESFDEGRQEVCELFGSERNLFLYADSVNKLMNDNAVAAKRILLDLVNEGVQPAYYAYALVLFKATLSQCDLLNSTEENVNVMMNHKGEIETVVRLLERANLMEPASSFLLGMLKRFNTGDCSRFMGGSWQDDLRRVVNVGMNCGFFDIEQYILECIDCTERSDFYGCDLGMQKKWLKKMALYSLYELTLNMSSEQFYNINAINDLFKILSENKFPQALYSHGATLLDGKTLPGNKKTAILFLNRAVLAGHKGAKLLLGTLPFNNKVGHTLTQHEITCYIRMLECSIYSSDISCTLHEETINKAAYRLAAEYMVKGSYIVLHNKQRAQEILSARNMYKELHDLQSRVELENQQITKPDEELGFVR